jgi:hypothetical protein
MIDEVVKVDERYTKSSFRVTADNISCKTENLQRPGWLKILPRRLQQGRVIWP